MLTSLLPGWLGWLLLGMFLGLVVVALIVELLSKK
jgi:hypothetical protein